MIAFASASSFCWKLSRPVWISPNWVVVVAADRGEVLLVSTRMPAPLPKEFYAQEFASRWHEPTRWRLGFTFDARVAPLAPMGHVILTNTAPWIALLPAAVTLFIASRRLRRGAADACQSCGYDLTNLDATTCPECGAEREAIA